MMKKLIQDIITDCSFLEKIRRYRLFGWAVNESQISHIHYSDRIDIDEAIEKCPKEFIIFVPRKLTPRKNFVPMQLVVIWHAPKKWTTPRMHLLKKIRKRLTNARCRRLYAINHLWQIKPLIPNPGYRHWEFGLQWKKWFILNGHILFALKNKVMRKRKSYLHNKSVVYR